MVWALELMGESGDRCRDVVIKTDQEETVKDLVKDVVEEYQKKT